MGQARNNALGAWMPTLDFKGKPFVYSHHLSVPFRELKVDAAKSVVPKVGKAGLDGNLIIHGDNLEALKALLPRYAGKVDVIYIDPPYNTGNEGWAYNDNVNSPLMKSWLGQVVDREDMERHDKWLCMMWPRLQLLRELLSKGGTIWISCDDEESHRLRSLLDDVFGADNFVCTITWQKRYVSNVTASRISDMHDFVHVYAREVSEVTFGRWERTEEQLTAYKNPDEDPRGVWRAQDLSASRPYNAGMFEITGPTGRVFNPPPNRYWRCNRAQFDEWVEDKRIWWGVNNDARPMLKSFLSESDNGLTPHTWWSYDFAGHNKEATLELKEIFDGAAPFETPKPRRLLERVLELADPQGKALVLDSFAGSGTTAHATLALNRADGGNRRFILVEVEDYADTLTAERVRRVIKGVPDSKDEALRAGLGGAFTYCELGEPIDLEAFFGGAGTAPRWKQVAEYVAYTATGQTYDAPPPDAPDEADWYAGTAGGARLHLIYKPDVTWMRSDAAALSAETAERIAKSAKAAGATNTLVFAANKFLSQRALTAMGLTFCQLPYSIHRILGDAPGDEA